MQKFLVFEIAMAIKDRPKVFQLVTLSLLSFSLTVILISYVARLSQTEPEKQVLRPGKVVGEAGFAATPAKHLVDLKK